MQKWPDVDSEYQGEWKGGMKNGNGTQQWADGSKYTGEWIDDVIQGRGKYTWGDQRIFAG